MPTYDPLEEDDGFYAMGGSSWLRGEIDRQEQHEGHWSGAEVCGRGHAKLLLDTGQITEAEYNGIIAEYDDEERA